MKEKCKNCEILESGSIIRLDLNGDCIFCGRNLHTQIVLQEPMTYTEKRLEEFDEYYPTGVYAKLLKTGEYVETTDTVKFLLSTSINQAIAENMAIVRGEIKEMAEPYDGAKWLNQIDPERLIKRLYSLDKPLTDK